MDQGVWGKLSENLEDTRSAALASDAVEVIRLARAKAAFVDTQLRFLEANPAEHCYSRAHDHAMRFLTAESAATKVLLEAFEASVEGDQGLAVARFQDGEALAAEAVRLQDQLPVSMAGAERDCRSDE